MSEGRVTLLAAEIGGAGHAWTVERHLSGGVPARDALAGCVDPTRRLAGTGTDPRVRGAAPYTTRLRVHQFRLTDPGQVDDVLRGYPAEACAVGRGDHPASR